MTLEGIAGVFFGLGLCLGCIIGFAIGCVVWDHLVDKARRGHD